MSTSRATARWQAPIGNNTGTTIGVGANGNTTLTATTNNNFVEANHPGTTGDSGISGGVGVTFGVTDVADMTWTINGNTIRNVDGNGILAVARGTNGTLKVKIQNNDVEAPQAGVRPGIRVDAGNTTAGTDNDVCLNISGNTSAGSGGSARHRPAQAGNEHDGARLRRQRNGGDQLPWRRNLCKWAQPGRQWYAAHLGDQWLQQLLAAVASASNGGGKADGRTLSF